MGKDKKGPPTVLYVDDEPHMLTIMSSRFKTNGYQVLEAEDGFQALEVVKKNKPDIIVLDINMPKMSGVELCSRLKAEPSTAPIPVVMLTCMTSDTLETECIHAGAVGIIYKPEIRELLILMKRILAGEKINWAEYDNPRDL